MTTEAKVGVFVIVSILVLTGTVAFVLITKSVKGQVPYKTYLSNAGGLGPGADVLFGGIKGRSGHRRRTRPRTRPGLRLTSR